MILRGVAIVTIALGGCRKPAPPTPVVEVPIPALPVEPKWPGTLTTVIAAVDAGRFPAADSVLLAFEQDEPGTPAAAESAFWRVLIRTDPRNPAFSPADARAALEGYLASPNAPRRTEATVMLRLLAIADSLRASQLAGRTAVEQRDRARDEELQRLRDDLQRTQAELDRIKRRLGQPRP